MKKSKLLLSIWLLLAISMTTVMFNSCDDDNDDGNNSKNISVADINSLNQTVSADNEQGKSDITFTTTGAWTSAIAEKKSSQNTKLLQISANAGLLDWISISPDHGDKADTYTVGITLKPNTTGADRTAIITISCNGTDITITVTQKGAEEDGVTDPGKNEHFSFFEDDKMVLPIGVKFNISNWGFTSSEIIFRSDNVVSSDENIVDLLGIDEEYYKELGYTGFMTYNITAKAEGTALLIAKKGNATDTCKVIVKEATAVINGLQWVFLDDNPTHRNDYFHPHFPFNSDMAGWRIPTQSDIQSLINAGSEWVTENGINGRRFGSVNNTLFLPAVGYAYPVSLTHNYGYNYCEFDVKGYYICYPPPPYTTGTPYLLFSENGVSIETKPPVSYTYMASGLYCKGSLSSSAVVINGVKWAACNVDAPGTFAATPEARGMLYQWNRKTGWSATNPMVNSDGGTTWDATTPGGTVWTKANDPSPAGWRVPTREEIQKLLDTENVSNQWTTENGVAGRKFTDKNTNASLFLPAAGTRYYVDGSLGSAGSYGRYWSSTQLDSYSAYLLGFDSDVAYVYDYHYRRYGFSVRCVSE